MTCCGPPDPNGLNEMFSGRYLEAELHSFRKRGLAGRQEFMLDRLRATGRVLDIGCGIGALGLSALGRGATEALLVDASAPSLAAARALATELGVAERAEVRQDDGAHLPDSASSAAVVMDRVVCCYPDATALLRRAARLSEEVLIFSYPAAAWWMRFGASAGNFVLGLVGRRYRFFVHDEKTLLDVAKSAGHRLAERRSFGVWRVVVLERVPRGSLARTSVSGGLP